MTAKKLTADQIQALIRFHQAGAAYYARCGQTKMETWSTEEVVKLRAKLTELHER
jgi:hypothetical protein